MAPEFNKKEYYAQRIDCPVCFKEYVRSNSSAHFKTQYHQDKINLIKRSLNTYEKRLIRRIIGFSTDQLRFISESDAEETENDAPELLGNDDIMNNDDIADTADD